MRTDKALLAYRLLSVADTEGLTSKDRIAIVRDIRVLRPVAEEAEKSVKEARESLKPEVLRQIERGELDVRNLDEGEKLTIDERIGEYNREMETALSDVMAAEADVKLTPMHPDTFEKFIERNPKWNASELDVLMELLVGE